MKLLSAAQIREWDVHTIRVQNMRSSDLMERAASACTNWITQNLPADSSFLTICGNGNNGGDGLAITRMLHQRGYGVKAFLLQQDKTLSEDCETNLQRLLDIDVSLVTQLETGSVIAAIPDNIILIDALLGTGLNRPTEGWMADFIKHINELPNQCISIDLPSGLFADERTPKEQTVIEADHTLSFQTYKRALLHVENALRTGKVHILDIGLDSQFQANIPTRYNTLDEAVAKSIYRPRADAGNKGTYGLAMIIGGSYGMMGAIVLGTQAAGRAGAGKVQSLIPECGYEILQTSSPDAMCLTNGEKHLEEIKEWEHAKGIGIGPGLGKETKTAKALAGFLDSCKQAIVIDADALNIIGAHKDLLVKIPRNTILTPHPKEFERLFGEVADSFARIAMARIQAMRYNITLVLKDPHTVIVLPDGQCYYNLNGNAGMATGGSGDVLTGILTGLLAQGYTPQQAALLGVYLHGAAGDAAAKKHGKESMLATDIVEHIGDAFATLQ